MARLESALESFFGDNGIGFRKGSSSFILNFCLNPGCRKEKHMYVRKTSGGSICFKCGTKWDWRGVVAAVAGVDRKVAYSVLYGDGAGDDYAEDWSGDIFDVTSEGLPEQKPDKPILLGMDFPSVVVSEEGLSYLLSRNVDTHHLFDFKIRWNGTMNAVVFPIFRDGIIYGWQARKIAPAPGELRLISSRFNKSKFLLNWDRAKEEKALIVTEGPFDCVAADAVKGIGAVATLGKGISIDQIDLMLKSRAEEIYIGLDRDAFEEMYELANVIGLRKKILRAQVPEGRDDFGESLPSEVERSIKTAVPMVNPSDYLEVNLK
jgi:hypothetical protein